MRCVPEGSFPFFPAAALHFFACSNKQTSDNDLLIFMAWQENTNLTTNYYREQRPIWLVTIVVKLISVSKSVVISGFP